MERTKVLLNFALGGSSFYYFLTLVTSHKKDVQLILNKNLLYKLIINIVLV